jgi:hypothetical protein
MLLFLNATDLRALEQTRVNCEKYENKELQKKKP